MLAVEGLKFYSAVCLIALLMIFLVISDVRYRCCVCWKVLLFNQNLTIIWESLEGNRDKFDLEKKKTYSINSYWDTRIYANDICFLMILYY